MCNQTFVFRKVYGIVLSFGQKFKLTAYLLVTKQRYPFCGLDAYSYDVIIVAFLSGFLLFAISPGFEI